MEDDSPGPYRITLAFWVSGKELGGSQKFKPQEGCNTQLLIEEGAT